MLLCQVLQGKARFLLGAEQVLELREEALEVQEAAVCQLEVEEEVWVNAIHETADGHLIDDFHEYHQYLYRKFVCCVSVETR